jgi:4'-phosphopantetheinyl transferase
MSISEDQAVVAVAWQRRVGIDIERIREDFDSREIAANVVSNAEAAAFQAAPVSAQTAMFFRIWTRKEAFVKALGSGLQRDLRSFDVIESGDHTMRMEHALIVDGEADEELVSWLTRDLHGRSGFASACCAEGSDWSIVNVGHDQ